MGRMLRRNRKRGAVERYYVQKRAPLVRFLRILCRCLCMSMSRVHMNGHGDKQTQRQQKHGEEVVLLLSLIVECEWNEKCSKGSPFYATSV